MNPKRKNQRNAVVRPPEADHGVRREGKGDQASGHLQVGGEKRVGQIGRIAQVPDEDEIGRRGDRANQERAGNGAQAPRNVWPKAPSAVPQQTLTL